MSGIELLDLPELSRQTLERVRKVDNKKAIVLHRYYSEIKSALQEMCRVLRPGKAAVIVVGNSVLRGISAETANCLGEIGKQAGFELVHIGIRHLDRDKRMLPVRNKNKTSKSKIEERMHEEYVIGFIKPENNEFALQKLGILLTRSTQCRSACTVQKARASRAKNLYNNFRDP